MPHEVQQVVHTQADFVCIESLSLIVQLRFFSSQGSGLLEFGEFCQLSARFLIEEDDEALKKELKEAFRIYDKEGL